VKNFHPANTTSLQQRKGLWTIQPRLVQRVPQNPEEENPTIASGFDSYGTAQSFNDNPTFVGWQF
jgi:hypothetical protein